MFLDLVLALHVAGGAAGLALGPLALARPRVRRPYAAAVLGVAATGALLGLGDLAALWWLEPFALLTAALVLTGVRGSGPAASRGLGGSYIALVTALLVVSTGSPLAWALPTALGVPLVEWAAARASRAPAASAPPARPRAGKRSASAARA